MALTKVELAEALVAKGFDKAQAKEFVEQFFNEIRKALASGEEVSISARRVVTFKASPKMRERVSAFKAKD